MDSPEDDDAAAEQLDTVGSIQQAKVTMDYHGALVQLPTMRAAGKQCLLLGYVDLIDVGQGHPFDRQIYIIQINSPVVARSGVLSPSVRLQLQIAS